MSKTVAAALLSHLAGNATTIAICWRLEKLDGTEYFFTDHDQDLVVSGDTYEAATGVYAAGANQTIGFGADTLDVMSMLSASKITEEMLRSGDLDGATLDVFIVNWNSIADGTLYIGKGWRLGPVLVDDDKFSAELRGIGDRLNQQIVESTSPTCRAKLGDARCKLDLDDSAGTYRYSGSITTAVNNYLFIDNAVDSAIVSDVFAHGKLVWDTGDNAGREYDIRAFTYSSGLFVLQYPTFDTPQVGDTFTAYYGCDGLVTTCKAFSNYVNFRGEPGMPGIDKLMEITTP